MLYSFVEKENAMQSTNLLHSIFFFPFTWRKSYVLQYFLMSYYYSRASLLLSQTVSLR